jgi:hypothetical protein
LLIVGLKHLDETSHLLSTIDKLKFVGH